MPPLTFSQSLEIKRTIHRQNGLRQSAPTGYATGLGTQVKAAPPLCNYAARRAKPDFRPMRYVATPQSGNGQANVSPGGAHSQSRPGELAASGGVAASGGYGSHGYGMNGSYGSSYGAPNGPYTSSLSNGSSGSGSNGSGSNGSNGHSATGAANGSNGGTANGNGFAAVRTAYYLPIDVSSRFGARLRELRRQRNMTQLRMATDFGIDRSFISDVERGRKSISLPMLEVIALGMQMTLSDLLMEI